MNILAIIPARGGSKGVPYKNIKLLAGKPLIQYSIDVALEAESIDKVIVSTDDKKISSVAEQPGVEVVLRPQNLAEDDSLVIDAIRHVLKVKKENDKIFDIVVLLEPTSPLRKPSDVDKAVKILQEKSADSLATFSETDVPPTRIWSINENIPKPFIDEAKPFLPRQKHEKGYWLNGMVYVIDVKKFEVYNKTYSLLFGNKAACEIPKERVVDIDTERDFFIAEQILKTNK